MIAMGRRLLDLVLPPLCLGCGAVVDSTGALCPACFGGVRFVAPPFCACCGTPVPAPAAEGSLCGACVDQPPPWSRARAAFVYDAGSRAMVLRFKHADRIDAAPAFARWMLRAGADLMEDADVVVPVPLHRWRLFARRYNQAALLGARIARAGGLTFVPDALARVRRTVPQGTFDRGARAKNVRGAFTVARPRAVEGKAVLLIDDVLTSGATAGECARALLAAGARSVDVLTLARVE
ncbi:ComF family protein [Novispirillum sp. DQ9]|uniref:ComF family protein n=1 Tax=Novispirillum sp. DQ9 TaxID=3398612 RepID=UPI003C7A0EB4